ncbi:MAG: hypothetical protein AB8H03_24495 [Saprospiraceae bacterium]
MKNSIFFKFAFCMFALTFFMTSCSKENVEVIEETVETLEIGMAVTLRGVTTTYDAYAAYCNVNGTEAYSVSNNAELLNNDIWTATLAEGDFVIHYKNDGTSEFFLGGTILEGEFNGQPITALSMTDGNTANISVTEANSTQVVGSMDGDFLFITDPVTNTFEMVPFAVTFTAEVDPNVVPVFCD